ncbi:MAG TPA: VWA domain-containing protein [Prolixibacteraceae bacterium]|nr:VWA domain-containing protein [Bacteroidales bacterium]HPB04756.1 VWA domain-containing protein [Prolixibacteraceae bacterium]HQN93518.1 VWA domain-containing protein [Prolixibacteraceae bacterium]
MDKYSFANPQMFYLFLALIPVIAWYVFRQKKLHASLQVSSTRNLEHLPLTWKHYLRHLLFAITLGVLSLLIVVLARPQSSENWENVQTEGIDIVMTIDVSTSMLARDLKPDRLEAAKEVATQFIAGRPYDRIGLVVFSGESFTQCPITTDHPVVINLLRNTETGVLEDGTAIGNGLATAVSRLKESKAISKVVILLTDGENNRGEIPPLTAAEIAKTYGVRVYTIGVGTIGTAPYPMQTPFGVRIQDVQVKIDEESLQSIADITGGKYFRATSNDKLKMIYEEIDALEKSKIEVKEFSKKQEEFQKYALTAMLLLVAGILLKMSVFRNIP